MATYSTQIEAAGGQDEVFEYLATFSNAREWDPGVVDGEALTPGPVAVGSGFRLGVRVAGRVVLQATHGHMTSTDAITVDGAGAGAGAGAGSRVRYVAVLKQRGVLRLASPLLARFFSAMADRAAAGLRATLA
jgi:Polyketide cyclase / dehydrase and lipid transport